MADEPEGTPTSAPSAASVPIKRKTRKQKIVRQYYIMHPDASYSEVMQATGISRRTVSMIRTEMVIEGTLSPGRNGPLVDLAGSKAPVATSSALLSGGDLLALAAAEDNDLDDLMADENTRKRMLREIRLIAFNGDAHPDTRMTAMQVWAKMKDASRARELGPGAPLTEEVALDRLGLLHKAVGIKLVLKSVVAIFGIQSIVRFLEEMFNVKKEPVDDRNVPADGTEATPSPAGTSGESGSSPDVQPAQKQ